jgi:hypothetical protein
MHLCTGATYVIHSLGGSKLNLWTLAAHQVPQRLHCCVALSWQQVQQGLASLRAARQSEGWH